jgi:hypothetical protein
VTISAAVIRNALVATGIALFNVAAQCHRSALLNGAHDAALTPTQ